MPNMSFRCSEELKAQLEKLAQTEKRSVSNLINLMLEDEVKRRTSRKK